MLTDLPPLFIHLYVMINISCRIEVRLETPSRTSLPLVSFEITKSWVLLSSDRPIYMMNSTMENVNGNWLISQASTFLSFKIGKVLKDIVPFIEPQSRILVLLLMKNYNFIITIN